MSQTLCQILNHTSPMLKVRRAIPMRRTVSYLNTGTQVILGPRCLLASNQSEFTKFAAPTCLGRKRKTRELREFSVCVCGTLVEESARVLASVTAVNCGLMGMRRNGYVILVISFWSTSLMVGQLHQDCVDVTTGLRRWRCEIHATKNTHQ